MAADFLSRRVSGVAGVLLGLAALWAPACQAATAPQARLVHCGSETCLRISGHRSSPAIAIRIAGQERTVEGDRAWRMTVPLDTARGWASRSGETLTIGSADPQSGAESRTIVALPPGALGHRLELASLMVHAH